MHLRTYISSDCKQLADLFYQTVHSVNAKDYTKEQLDAWATGKVDLYAWDKSFLEHYTVVAVEDGMIVGFGDIDETGHIDRLYVHKDHQGEGIATAICDELEQHTGKMKVTTYASITAKSFFERRGYQAVKRQEVVRDGVSMVNFVMKKEKI